MIQTGADFAVWSGNWLITYGLFLEKLTTKGDQGGFLFHHTYVLSFINKPELKLSWFVISKWEYMIIFYPNMIYF